MNTNTLTDLVHEAQDQLWVDKWVSTFHPNKFPCKRDGILRNGTFNAAWIVRFPRPGMIGDNANEKIAMEVAALDLICDKTTIPVPTVQAWGLATSNPLNLGLFIIMDFIDGVSLSDLLRDPNTEHASRVIREDIIYSSTLLRPLTFKAHCDRTQGFTTTTEYFQYIVNQDWEQLIHQPNSIEGEYDAKAKYIVFKVLKTLVPDLVNEKYDYGKFKLICDDLGLANLIIHGKEDLTIVGVIDLEWSYIGPAQPVNLTWDCKGGKLPEIAPRYFKYLDIFIHVLEEEETKFPGYEKRELSSLPEELKVFASRKVHELEKYDKALEQIEKSKALMNSGKIIKEEFIAKGSSLFVMNNGMPNNNGLLYTVVTWITRQYRYFFH
ncbi:hypothetical protein BDV26DRAFT_279219 [Aspergillus bertholletiae]|uniref:Aminoglycoside phosphotransferase domain-containing protein n=1 Tax=Aspergillus bertholletiae TaxID=1226010 RepID=A0A5N7BGL2_9EURO|nr:hypothetical protein BDV26DRAFT_279219 [Aspergillus bertholletiae]